MSSQANGRKRVLTIAVIMLTAVGCTSLPTGASQQLSGYVTAQIAAAPVMARVAAEDQLSLVIDLPIQDAAGLKETLKEISDPKAPLFHQFMNPEQFADRFGASTIDYQAAIDWARANHLTVNPHRNRLVLEVTGAAADVETALNVHFNHALREDGTQFRKPDREPSLSLSVPIDRIENVDDFVVRRVASGQGDGTGRLFNGNGVVTAIDIRNAYLKGTPLTGAGQTVGVISNGTGNCFNQSDISGYVTANNLQNVATVPTVQVAQSSSLCTAGQSATGELTLDIEMVTAMAPGAQIIVANEDSGKGAFNYFADNEQVSQITSSYSWSKLSQSDLIALGQLAADGQSFVTYAGDSGAYTSSSISQNIFVGGEDAQLMVNALGDPPLTLAGGTALFMNGSTVTSEQAWDEGALKDAGGGGILSVANDQGVSIPPYQTLLFTNGAVKDGQVSQQYRNSPDVSALASDVEVFINGSLFNGYDYGTSASSPLWAGFLALVNQAKLTQTGVAGLGFANPLLYAHAGTFTDITEGTNPTKGCSYSGQCVYGGPASAKASCACYTAQSGYDLSTGLGTPNLNLVDALSACPTGTILCGRTHQCMIEAACLSLSCLPGQHFCVGSNVCVPNGALCPATLH